jgi:hypothetical protein
MKKKLSEVTLNKRNPRKISIINRRKLMINILLFNKMLEIRDVVINKENVVIGGNMRVTILNDIANMSMVEIDSVLWTSKEYAGYSEGQKQAIFDTWEAWKKELAVEVTLADLSADEEDEFVIKDNLSFGEFNIPALKDVYSEDQMVELGFDEALFYKIEEDSSKLAPKIEGSNGKNVDYLRIGPIATLISREEYSRLVELFEEHKVETGTSYGFVRKLLSIWKR